MTYHSSNCFSIVLGQGSAPLVAHPLQIFVMTHVPMSRFCFKISSHELHNREIPDPEKPTEDPDRRHAPPLQNLARK